MVHHWLASGGGALGGGLYSRGEDCAKDSSVGSDAGVADEVLAAKDANKD